MRIERKPFNQNLFHEIENEEEANNFLDDSLPLIGYITMWFNGLEKSLDQIICEIFSDRSDSTGLIVLQKMNYSSKVDLFKRFSDDFHSYGNEIESYSELITNLKECGRLRNMVIHADWENTNEKGFTYFKLKISKNGMEQEYIQFSEDSLSKILKLILKTRNDLYAYWEKRNDSLHKR